MYKDKHLLSHFPIDNLSPNVPNYVFNVFAIGDLFWNQRLFNSKEIYVLLYISFFSKERRVHCTYNGVEK